MKYILIVLPSILLCACSTYNSLAPYEPDQAREAIKAIKEQGIVVVFPTYHKKEKALLKMMNNNPSLEEDLQELRKDREELWSLWNEHKTLYTFSEMMILPDSLMTLYLGNRSKQADDQARSLRAMSDIYVLYREYGAFDVKKEGKFIPNPFPSRVDAAFGSAIKDFLGVQGDDKSIKRFFSKLDEKLRDYSIVIL